MKRNIVWLMAITSGAAAANMYYNQPLLAAIAQSLDASVQDTGLIPTLSQIGYALGNLLIVPLGDLLERRRLIVTMLTATALALGMAALSPNITWLIVASLLIGTTTIVPQITVPFAALLAPPQARGKVVGTVMSGLLIGILLARTVSGFVGAEFGWRAMYWIASGFMLVLAIALFCLLPKSQPAVIMSYQQLMHSMLKLLREPVLQKASLTGAMAFGSFSVFWSTLVFFLEQPPYNYGSDIAGLFGLIGVVGAAAAPMAGRLADKRSPRLAVVIGLIATAFSFLVFWLFGYQLWGLIVGVILLDLGVQVTTVSNQALIYSLPEEAHSRLNALFITFYFVGGALGSFLSTYGWNIWQWNGVCATGLLMLIVAFAGLFIIREQRQKT
ncbi:MFS transporter permease [Nostoc linckia z18]|uniref:MFS transporter permease n=2 Tax=Nostoc linckia TaxID=92942 RepID=A0A9Q6EN61_NOSLI|nr:MFS transporter [Nostoc linckia]PHK40660.1 MFS transporter permease [Nostoc linckia z15]PHK43666.1 MFS transporter permease [Nostoc linckia z16]PHJ63705.1 MFS transporter permease [Nostoc linckia z1]PHJ69311.1 MFS transporter permease [Nostoc linckia z3]PHJ72440.1 MFS transporter permease [Nostoc linckia z2]